MKIKCFCVWFVPRNDLMGVKIYQSNRIAIQYCGIFQLPKVIQEHGYLIYYCLIYMQFIFVF